MDTDSTNNPNSASPIPSSTTAGRSNTQTAGTSSHAGKEIEPGSSLAISKDIVSDIVKEVELPREVLSAGVTYNKEFPDIPPDLKNLGLTHSGSSTPVVSTPYVAPPIVLPIPDSEVVTGLHAKVSTAIRWLATWCTKKLKRAKVILKIQNGKVIRVGLKTA